MTRLILNGAFGFPRCAMQCHDRRRYDYNIITEREENRIWNAFKLFGLDGRRKSLGNRLVLEANVNDLLQLLCELFELPVTSPKSFIVNSCVAFRKDLSNIERLPVFPFFSINS